MKAPRFCSVTTTRSDCPRTALLPDQKLPTSTSYFLAKLPCDSPLSNTTNNNHIFLRCAGRASGHPLDVASTPSAETSLQELACVHAKFQTPHFMQSPVTCSLAPSKLNPTRTPRRTALHLLQFTIKHPQCRTHASKRCPTATPKKETSATSLKTSTSARSSKRDRHLPPPPQS